MNSNEVLEARTTISDSVIRTPLVYSKFFSETCGGRVYLRYGSISLVRRTSERDTRSEVNVRW